MKVLTSVGYGEANPIEDNSTAAGREANRRIEFRLLEPAASGKDIPKTAEETPSE